MKELGAALEPGKAAVIFLIRKVTVDKVLPQIKIPGSHQTSLDGNTELQLTEALAAAGAAAVQGHRRTQIAGRRSCRRLRLSVPP